MLIGMMAGIKLFIWAAASLDLFSEQISKYCAGDVYVYGLILAIFHGFLLVCVCCYCICKGL